MSTEQSGLEWFDSNIKPLLGGDFELKYVDEKDGDLGDLQGVQFDSSEKGGYIYFWSSGYVGYQLVDYNKEVEIVKDTTKEIASKSYNELFKDILSGLA